MPGLGRHRLSPVRTFPFAPSNHILPSHPLHPIIPETQFIIGPVISLFDVAIAFPSVLPPSSIGTTEPVRKFYNMVVLSHGLPLQPSQWLSVRSFWTPNRAFFQVDHQVLQQFAWMSSGGSGWQLTESDPGVFACAHLLPNELTLLEN